MSSTVSNDVFRFLQLQSTVLNTTTDPTQQTQANIDSAQSIINAVDSYVANTITLQAVSNANTYVTTTQETSDLSNYLKMTGGDMTGALVLHNNAMIIYPDGSNQNTGFTNSNATQLQDVIVRTQQITIDPSTNYTTIPVLSVSTLNIPNNALSINNYNVDIINKYK